jgi:hypothetical protein
MAKKFSLDEIQNARITHNSCISPKEPTIYVRDSIYAIRGSFSIVSGLPKSGKTTVIRTLFTTALMPDIPETYDSLFIRASYCNDNPIIYFNTEMTDSDTKDFHDKIIKDLKLTQTPENLFVFHLLEYSHTEKMDFIKSVFEQIPNIHLAIIDGGADLVTSVNEERESNEAVNEIVVLAQKYKSTIVTIIHENRGNQKVRGHFGQQAERKCSSSISVAKEADGTFRIDSHICRHSEDFKTIHFSYDKEMRRMVTIDKATGTESKTNDLKYKITEVFKDAKILDKKALKRAMYKLENPHEEKTSEKTRKQVERAFDKAMNLAYITTDGSPEKIRILI